MLDLAGALVDGRDLRVAHVALDRVVGRVAVAAVDLHGLDGGPLRELRRVELRHRGFLRERLARVLEPRGAVDEEAGRVDARGHVGELPLDGLVRADGPSELLALLRVRDHHHEGGARDAHVLRADADAAGVERLHGELEAVALRADAGRLGDPRVLQVERARDAAAQAHLVLLRAQAEAFRERRGEEEAREAAVPGRGVRARDENDVARFVAVRDPDLRAVDAVAVAIRNGRSRNAPFRRGRGRRHGRIADRGGLQAARVAAGAGAAEAAAPDARSVRELREGLALLLFRALLQERVDRDARVHAVRHAHARVPARQLLHDLRVRPRREAGAAIFGRNVGSQEPQLGHLHHLAPGEDLLLVALLGRGPHFPLAELAHRLQDQAILIRHVERRAAHAAGRQTGGDEGLGVT